MKHNKFVNCLMKKNPKLMTRALKKILKLDESVKLEYSHIGANGDLIFEIKWDDRNTSYALVNDFTVHWLGEGEDVNSLESMQWMDVMVRVFKEKYVEKFMLVRQNEVNAYIKEFNESTNLIANKLKSKLGMVNNSTASDSNDRDNEI
ncbi:MAG: hypothetical protein J6A28_01775 [Clostridia bacterium]|nr:hypothetical protein [Clostridia bacterium]